MQGRGSRIPDKAKGEEKVIAFPRGGVQLFLKQDGYCRIQIHPVTESPTATHLHGSLVPPTLDSPCETTVCAAFFLLWPKVSGCKHKTCALAALRIKTVTSKSTSGFVTSGSHLCSAETNLTTFTAGCQWSADSGPEALHPGAWFVFTTLLLLRVSSHSCAAALACCPCEWTSLFNDFNLPVRHFCGFFYFLFLQSLVKSLFFKQSSVYFRCLVLSLVSFPKWFQGEVCDIPSYSVTIFFCLPQEVYVLRIY